MKRKFLILLSLLLTVSLAGCNKEAISQNEVSPVDYSTISLSDVTEDMQLLDIRQEYKYIGWADDNSIGGHIPNALDFPESWLSMDFKNAAISTDMNLELSRREIDLDKATVIYDNGTASEDSFNKYVALGFKKLTVLDGGFKAYSDTSTAISSLKNYRFYVHPQWVQDLVDGKAPEKYTNNNFKIIEISLASEDGDYEKGHIPGAINIDDSINHVPGVRVLEEYETIPIEKQLTFWNKNNDQVTKSKLEEMGITKDTTVILYGSTAATTAASRAALIMKYAGVKDIRILNGGKTLWTMENRKLESGINTPVRVDFGTTVPQHPEVIINYEDELAMVNNPDGVIASIRSWDEYTGKVSGYTYIGEAGDIANSRFGYAGSGPYSMEDYRNVDNTMFNYETIAKRWAKWGIVPDKKIAFHCGTGWRASETYFYAYAMGWDDIAVYDGGWYEWHKYPESPRKDAGIPSDAPEQKPDSFFMSER